VQRTQDLPPLPAALRPLQTLIALTERERDQALDALRRAEADGDAARRQDDVLARYARELDDRWGARPGVTGSTTRLELAHGFGCRIDQARQQQRSHLARLDERADRARAHWRSCEQRLAMVRKLVDRRLQARAAEASRRDQRETDEAASRIAYAASVERAAEPAPGR
jgi:flagellar FliJ protein